jgi:phosphonate transport system permease protein
VIETVTLKTFKTFDFFLRRRLQFLLVYLVIAGVAVIATIATDFDFIQSIACIPKAIHWMISNIIPDQSALKRLPDILKKLLDTVLVSVMATVCAAFLSFFFAIMGSTTTRLNPVFAVLARGIASVNRNIPVPAWAMIFLISFGQSNLTGFLALFFETFGFLTRAFMETIDETSKSSVEAMRATGATYGHTIFQAVIPSTLPQIMSWILFMIETNIRSATLVGILTGTGIGFSFDLYYKSLNYKAAFLVVISVVIVVLLLEAISNSIRRRIL